MKLLAFGDLHLGAGGALGREPGDRLHDQEQVLEQIISVAGLRGVDAILMGGDLFEGPAITPEQLDAFMRPFEQLEGEIPIIGIRGNGRHDLAMRPVDALQPLRHVPGVHSYSVPALHDLGPVMVACLPWVSPARLVAGMNGDIDRDQVNAHAAELLVRVAAGICDPAIKPAVLLLHGSISGASLPAGISTDLLREPVLDLGEIENLGYAAVVASHIHVPQITTPLGGWTSPSDLAFPLRCLDVHTPVLYTGSPLPLNFGEAQVPHGVWIIDVDDEGTTVEFVLLESRPLFQWEVELNDLPLADVGLDALPEIGLGDVPAGAIAKIRISGTRAQLRRLDLSTIRGALLDEGAHTVKIETETIREERARVEGVTGDLDPLEAFDAWVNANDIVAATATSARERMEADLEQVGA